mmetsp:Transcript_2058/g.5380  ORF Transcript_2058/g.5380 Transcript_2058/m.5380 type:complete len:215 (-) Transcript_2058:402-1046(-)
MPRKFFLRKSKRSSSVRERPRRARSEEKSPVGGSERRSVGSRSSGARPWLWQARRMRSISFQPLHVSTKRYSAMHAKAMKATTTRKSSTCTRSNISSSSVGVPKIWREMDWGTPVLTNMKTMSAMNPSTVSSLKRICTTGFMKSLTSCITQEQKTSNKMVMITMRMRMTVIQFRVLSVSWKPASTSCLTLRYASANAASSMAFLFIRILYASSG